MTTNDPDWRGGKFYWGLVGFLVGFFVVVILVAKMYLWPVAAAAYNSDAPARRALAALSALVMTLVLVGLLATLVLLIRPGRLFLPRKSSPRVRTPYVDAWAEAGKRLGENEVDKGPGPENGN